MDTTLGTALTGGAIALIGKIVWDWLSNRKVVNEEKKTRQDCARIIALEEKFHQAHLSLAQDVASMKADIAYIKRKLDLNGNK